MTHEITGTSDTQREDASANPDSYQLAFEQGLDNINQLIELAIFSTCVRVGQALPGLRVLPDSYFQPGENE